MNFSYASVLMTEINEPKPASTAQELWKMSELALRDARGELNKTEREKFIALMGLGPSNDATEIIIMQRNGTNLEVSQASIDGMSALPYETVLDFFPAAERPISKSQERGSSRFERAVSWVVSRVSVNPK